MPTDLTPELRRLAQSLLTLLEPLVDAGVAYAATAASDEPGRCQQLWCPVCAVAALASGEQHPLGSLIAEHGPGLLPLLRTLLTPTTPDADQADREPDAPGRYQHIDVTIVE